MYEHRLAPRLLLRAFDSVLEARGLRCESRAAFCGAVGHAVSLRRWEASCQLGGYSKDPFIFRRYLSLAHAKRSSQDTLRAIWRSEGALILA